MLTTNDVHRQFSDFFPDDGIKPIAYLLSKKLSEGHICIAGSDLENEVITAGTLLGTDSDLQKPFISHAGKFYLQRYFKYETGILSRIVAWMEKKKTELIPDTESQDFASQLPLKNQFSIITGGPGTGKTTTVARALSMLIEENPALRIALAAPTGKAAARLAESLKNSSRNLGENVKRVFETLEPVTIHRLLGNMPNSHYFRYNRENPLPYDVVVIDESSMIDAALFAKLIDAVNPSARLVMLGDKDQLASVEAGSLFGDICDALLSVSAAYQNIAYLRKSYRFSDDKGIGRLSKAVINGNVADIEKMMDEQIQIDTGYAESVFDSFIDGYRDFILETDTRLALQKFNTIRVLTAIRAGEQGLTAINKRIEKYLQQQKLIKPVSEFYINRPVMVGRNHYEVGVFNGDTGIVRPDENGILKVWFEDSSGDLKSVLPGFISEAETAFAMTIHKSQGSEYDRILTILPKTDLPILTSELLYTAISRAKSKLIIQAATEVIQSCAQRRVQRASGISERLKNAL